MCGIGGIAWTGSAPGADEPALKALRDAMIHRGPDDAGLRLVPGCGLASRRLAILDLSERGHMPMSSPDGRHWIVYNGEAYNYRDVRERLRGLGHEFRSDTDTEVILRGYQVWGPDVLQHLNGMFAIAIWDEAERTLFLARDRMGIKPLYYRHDPDGTLRFASEAKALFAAGLDAEFDPETLGEIVTFGHVAGERTPFRGVRRLLPGHWLTWRDGDIRIGRWWHLPDRVLARRESPPDSGSDSEFVRLFQDSVALRRISDVPVGILLSGGLDSGSLALELARQAGQGAASFTVRFREAGYDEGPLARLVAEAAGLDHHELELPETGMFERFVRASRFNDEPLTHGSDPHLMAIAEVAKPKVTVLLSGEGADELMGGYVRYQPLRYPHLLSLGRYLPTSWAAGRSGRLAKLARLLAIDSHDAHVFWNSAKAMPAEAAALGLDPTPASDYRRQVLDEARVLYPGEPLRQAMHLDQRAFLNSVLDRNDRMTMAASIECRVPFLDYRIVEWAGALPTSKLFAGLRGKGPMRRTVVRELPRAIRRHRKWGFGVPWSNLLRHDREFREWIAALWTLPPLNAPPFDARNLRSLSHRFLEGDDRPLVLVLQLALLAIWHREFFRKPHSTSRDRIAVLSR